MWPSPPRRFGVNGGKAILGTTPTGGLIHLEPARYGTLVHPGDQYALDMFAQIGQALRAPHVGPPWGACTPGTSWPPVSPSRPST